MSQCQREMCPEETADGEAFCSDRCERRYRPGPSPDQIERNRGHYDQAEARSRRHVIDNDRGHEVFKG